MVWAARIRFVKKKEYIIDKLIDEVSFLRAQQIPVGRTKEVCNKHRWPLSGVLECYCGRTMVGTTSTWREKIYRYYFCSANATHPTKFAVRADKLEAEFVQLLATMGSDDEEETAKFDSKTTSSELIATAIRDRKTDITSAQKRKNVILDNIENDSYKVEDWQPRLDNYTTQISELNKIVADLTKAKLVADSQAKDRKKHKELFAGASTTFQKASEEDQRDIAKKCAIEAGGFVIKANGSMGRRIFLPKLL